MGIGRKCDVKTRFALIMWELKFVIFQTVEVRKKYHTMYEKSRATPIDFGKAPRWMVPVKEY